MAIPSEIVNAEQTIRAATYPRWSIRRPKTMSLTPPLLTTACSTVQQALTNWVSAKEEEMSCGAP